MKCRVLAVGLGLASGLAMAEKPAPPPVIKVYQAENTVLEHRLKDLETAAGIKRTDWTYIVPIGTELIIRLESKKNGKWVLANNWTINEKNWGSTGVLTAKVRLTSGEERTSTVSHAVQAEFEVWGAKNGESYSVGEVVNSGERNPRWGFGHSRWNSDEIKGAAKTLWHASFYNGSEEVELIRVTVFLRTKAVGK